MIPMSLSRLPSQVSSAAVSDKVRYSASVEFRETVGYFRADQKMMLLPKNVQNSSVDLLVSFDLPNHYRYRHLQ